MAEDYMAVRRATRFALELRNYPGGIYRVLHGTELVHEGTSRTIADAYFELERDRLDAVSGTDPRARARAEQGSRDASGLRSEAAGRARDQARRGGKGGRGGV